ncbi:MAG TPA: hypothetical protein PKA00_13505 [Saprospiraceae bacterium]|nr:hypothetical protein [Saprospiraceae bacterium]HMQ83926.1 hypothetical protein [Saprospiraceae bacterium]
MKKIIKRTIAGTLLFAFVAITGLVALIFYPQAMFANKFEYKQFEVYYDKDYDMDKAAFQTLLDDAYQIVEQCELHNPDFKYQVFLAHNNLFNKIEGLQGGDVLARATAWNIIVKKEIDLKSNRMYTDRSVIDLTVLMVHEMVHILQADRYGLLNFSPLKHPPMWKLEGYPEYVARSSYLNSASYDLRQEIQRFVSADEASKYETFEAVAGHFMPTYYFKGRIMVEYLMNIKGMTYDDILKDPRTEEAVFNEMLEWAEGSEK